MNIEIPGLELKSLQDLKASLPSFDRKPFSDDDFRDSVSDFISSVAKRLKTDIDKFPVNLTKYGNTSAASIPILLDEMNKDNLLKEGQKLVLSGFGGGLTWGASYIEL